MNQIESPLPANGPSIFAFSDRESSEAVLHDAIVRDQIGVFFQPQMDAVTRRIIGAEALVRCSDPELGKFGTRNLFAMARHAHLTDALSRRAVEKALELALEWPDHLHLSINIFPSEFENPGFEAGFLKLLNETAFPLERLVIEITEGEPLQDIANAAEILGRLKSRGISIALDDFGAGYCNFNYLKRLPLDTIKLDRSIIDGVAEDKRDLAILRNMVSLARALDLEVVAEGIENKAQEQIVIEEGCGILQGYLIGRPVDANALLAMIAV